MLLKNKRLAFPNLLVRHAKHVQQTNPSSQAYPGNACEPLLPNARRPRLGIPVEWVLRRMDSKAGF